MKKTPLRKQSKIKISVLKRKLLEDVKKMIRESGPCAMIGVQKNCGGVMQASHVLPEGAYKNLFVDPLNIFPACYTHHMFVWHKSPLEAEQWFRKAYPIRWDYLQKVKKVHIDWRPEKIATLRSSVLKGFNSYFDAYNEMIENQ